DNNQVTTNIIAGTTSSVLTHSVQTLATGLSNSATESWSIKPVTDRVSIARINALYHFETSTTPSDVADLQLAREFPLSDPAQPNEHIVDFPLCVICAVTVDSETKRLRSVGGREVTVDQSERCAQLSAVDQTGSMIGMLLATPSGTTASNAASSQQPSKQP